MIDKGTYVDFTVNANAEAHALCREHGINAIVERIEWKSTESPDYYVVSTPLLDFHLYCQLSDIITSVMQKAITLPEGDPSRDAFMALSAVALMD